MLYTINWLEIVWKTAEHGAVKEEDEELRRKHAESALVIYQFKDLQPVSL